MIGSPGSLGGRPASGRGARPLFILPAAGRRYQLALATLRAVWLRWAWPEAGSHS
jgi:hypothetical protein